MLTCTPEAVLSSVVRAHSSTSALQPLSFPSLPPPLVPPLPSPCELLPLPRDPLSKASPGTGSSPSLSSPFLVLHRVTLGGASVTWETSCPVPVPGSVLAGGCGVSSAGYMCLPSLPGMHHSAATAASKATAGPWRLSDTRDHRIRQGVLTGPRLFAVVKS